MAPTRQAQAPQPLPNPAAAPVDGVSSGDHQTCVGSNATNGAHSPSPHMRAAQRDRSAKPHDQAYIPKHNLNMALPTRRSSLPSESSPPASTHGRNHRNRHPLRTLPFIPLRVADLRGSVYSLSMSHSPLAVHIMNSASLARLIDRSPPHHSTKIDSTSCFAPQDSLHSSCCNHRVTALPRHCAASFASVWQTTQTDSIEIEHQAARCGVKRDH